MYTIINNPPIDSVIEDSFFNFEYSPEIQGRSEEFFRKIILSENGFLLIPPIVIENNGKYEVVVGKEPLKFVYERYGSVPQLLLIAGISDRKKLFRIVLRLKTFLYGLNPVEKALVLKKAIDLEEEPPRDILNILEIPEKLKIIELYLKINETSERFKRAIASGVIDPQTAFRIFLFPVAMWDYISEFVKGLKIGTKHKNRLLEMIYDISRRDGTSPISLINSKEVKMILDSEIDPPQKAQKIFMLFEKLRYPTIYRYRESFGEEIKKIGLKDGFDFSYDPTFEKRDFKITFSFSSIEDFRNKIERLTKISNNERLKIILEDMPGIHSNKDSGKK